MSDAKQKWTPGPWEVVSKFVGPLQVQPVGVDEPVALVGHDTFAIAQANAELIAAAPELYDALVIAKALVEQLPGKTPRLGVGMLAIQRALRNADGVAQ